MRVLKWLPAPPENFRSRCKAAEAEGTGSDLQSLAGFDLDATQSLMLSRAISRARTAGRDLAPLSPFRLALLSGSTDDTLADALPAAAARYGVGLELIRTHYNQVVQQALDADSAVDATVTAALILVDQRWLGLTSPVPADRAEEQLAIAFNRLRLVAEAIAGRGVGVIVSTIAAQPERLLGSFDRLLPGSPAWFAAEFNQRLAQMCRQQGYYLLDIEALASRFGLDRWFDPVQWNSYKLAFSAEADVLVADSVGRLLGAIRGQSRKCLVLDLDNTVWGGAIGDEGVGGIVLGEGSAAGEAFLAVQKLALDLRSRGVMLAVSSKNDEANARAPFREHPDMLLREDHISVFQANWSDKASNIEAIARSLNIGLDALVFLDDNPAERARVRAALPMVAVPELPADMSLYARTLGEAGYFESVTFSQEDAVRAQAYAAEATRAEFLALSAQGGDHLTGLGMVLTAGAFDPAGRPRITQLVNKSNQFNLTTRRRTEAEIAALEQEPGVLTLQARLKDTFGDMGMIAVIVAVPTAPATWELDTWLMSCRVLGRRVEDAMLSILVSRAKQAGVRRLIGVYCPTAKNGMVKEHYSKLGFTRLKNGADTTQRFELEIDNYIRPDLPMTIVLSGEPESSA